MILNINYNTIFDNLRFQFKNQIYYLEVCSIIFFFILMLNKIHIYFVNVITCKNIYFLNLNKSDYIIAFKILLSLVREKRVEKGKKI